MAANGTPPPKPPVTRRSKAKTTPGPMARGGGMLPSNWGRRGTPASELFPPGHQRPIRFVTPSGSYQEAMARLLLQGGLRDKSGVPLYDVGMGEARQREMTPNRGQLRVKWSNRVRDRRPPQLPPGVANSRGTGRLGNMPPPANASFVPSPLVKMGPLLRGGLWFNRANQIIAQGPSEDSDVLMFPSPINRRNPRIR